MESPKKMIFDLNWWKTIHSNADDSIKYNIKWSIASVALTATLNANESKNNSNERIHECLFQIGFSSLPFHLITSIINIFITATKNMKSVFGIISRTTETETKGIINFYCSRSTGLIRKLWYFKSLKVQNNTKNS